MDHNYFVAESSIGGAGLAAKILSNLNFWSTVEIGEILVRNVYSVGTRNKIVGIETVSAVMSLRKRDIEEDLKKIPRSGFSATGFEDLKEGLSYLREDIDSLERLVASETGKTFAEIGIRWEIKTNNSPLDGFILQHVYSRDYENKEPHKYWEAWEIRNDCIILNEGDASSAAGNVEHDLFRIVYDPVETDPETCVMSNVYFIKNGSESSDAIRNVFMLNKVNQAGTLLSAEDGEFEINLVDPEVFFLYSRKCLVIDKTYKKENKPIPF